MVQLIARFRRWLTGEDEFRAALDRFTKLFPMLCPVCSYARYGRNSGVADAWPPGPHQCIERPDAPSA